MALVTALVAAATQVSAETTANRDVAPHTAPIRIKNVAYSVVVVQAGHVERTVIVRAAVGAPQSIALGSRGADITCTGIVAPGRQYNLHTTAGNELQLTVFPAKEEDGVITTVMQASDSQAKLGATAILDGCVVPIGHMQARATFDVAALQKGGQHTLDLDNGTTVVVQLIDLEREAG